MSTQLERSYGLLLRCYPPDIRQQRGAEMLSVLLEGSESGWRQPRWRESVSLIVGGLRTRAGWGGRTLGALWPSAGQVAIVLLLGGAAAVNVDVCVSWLSTYFSPSTAVVDTAVGSALESAPLLPYLSTSSRIAVLFTAAGLYCMAVLLVGCCRYDFALVASGIACVGAVAASPMPVRWLLLADGMWLGPAAFLLIVVLAVSGQKKARARRRTSMIWLSSVPLAALLLPTSFAFGLGIQPWAYLGIIVAASALAWIDLRITIGVALLLLPGLFLSVIGYLSLDWSTGQLLDELLWYGIPIAILLGAGALVLQREMRV